MTKRLPVIRYYLVFTARWIAVIFLPATFLIILVFGAGNWKEILGLGITGLVALFWSRTIGRKWERDKLIRRLSIKLDNYLFVITSSALGLLFFLSAIYSIIFVEHTIIPIDFRSIYIEFQIGLGVIVFFLISIIRLFQRKSRNDIKSAKLPFLISSSSIILVFLLHGADKLANIGLHIRLQGYREIVSRVESHSIIPDQQGYAKLPWNYSFLSEGGEILIIEKVDLTSVLFFTSRGIHGDIVAIAYRSNGTPPTNKDEDGCVNVWRVDEFDENWYMCISD